MAEIKEDPRVFMAKLQAARMGCGQCGAAVRVPPAGDPFAQGPHIGRYWCTDCWTLFLDEHPDHLADDESRKYVIEESRRIRLKRGSEVLYEEEDNRVYKTPKGNIVFDFRTSKELPQNEYDLKRFSVLMRAIKALEAKAAAPQPVRV